MDRHCGQGPNSVGTNCQGESDVHLVVCLTTGPKPLPKRALHIVWSRASSCKWEYPLLSLRSSSSFLLESRWDPILIPLASSQHNLYDIYLLLCIQYLTPDEKQKTCWKHVGFYSKNKFEKLVHLIGFIIRIYHDAWSSECQMQYHFSFVFHNNHHVTFVFTFISNWCWVPEIEMWCAT